MRVNESYVDITQCRLGRGLPPPKWHLNPSSRLTTTDMGQKSGAVPLFGGAGYPSNTICPGQRLTSLPSFILIHRTSWSQGTNVADKTARQRSDRIGRTVLQTIAQKRKFNFENNLRVKEFYRRCPMILNNISFGDRELADWEGTTSLTSLRTSPNWGNCAHVAIGMANSKDF